MTDFKISKFDPINLHASVMSCVEPNSERSLVVGKICQIGVSALAIGTGSLCVCRELGTATVKIIPGKMLQQDSTTTSAQSLKSAGVYLICIAASIMALVAEIFLLQGAQYNLKIQQNLGVIKHLEKPPLPPQDPVPPPQDPVPPLQDSVPPPQEPVPPPQDPVPPPQDPVPPPQDPVPPPPQNPVPAQPSEEEVIKAKKLKLKDETIEAKKQKLNEEFELGKKYLYGIDVEIDPIRAYAHLKTASDGCYITFAHYLLGKCYKKGIGVPKDQKKALELFQRAAGKGCAEALYEIGRHYEKRRINGEPVSEDKVRALSYYRQSIKKGYVRAKYRLSDFYYKLIPEEIELDSPEGEMWFKKSVYWLTKAAEDGYAPAQYKLGLWNLDGFGLEEEHCDVAVEWFKSAAKQNHPEAMYKLAECYENGFGVEVDFEAAIKWYTKSANLKNHSAARKIAFFCLKGLGVQQSFEAAIVWYEKAAELGNLGAQKELGNLYHHGISVEKDLDKAIKFYTMAADQGDENSQRQLYALTQPETAPQEVETI